MANSDDGTDDFDPRVGERFVSLWQTIDGLGLEILPDRRCEVFDLALLLENPPEDQLAAPRIARGLGVPWRVVSRVERAA